MRKGILYIMLLMSLPLAAQHSSFDDFKKQQNAKFEQFKSEKQSEYDAFRKRVNEAYAEFMRQPWDPVPMNEADKPIEEKTLPPVVYQEPEPKEDVKPEPKPIEEVKPEPKPEPEEEKPLPREEIDRLNIPKTTIDTKPVEMKPIEIAVKPVVVVVPKPQPAPEPIAPVQPKEEPYKKVTLSYFGTLITIGFPLNDDLKLRSLNEESIVNAWKKLSDSRYDIMVKTSLDARKANNLCDWAYMNVLREATEQQYGKTNEAVLAQAFLMVQSGYRIRLGMCDPKLYMLVASNYDIFNLRYYKLDGVKYYNVAGDRPAQMLMTKAKWEKEKSLSLQLTKLPKLNNSPTAKRTLSSKKGVTSSVIVNKNLIDFFNTYPQACFNGDQTTRWAAFANTPVEKSVKDQLYPPLKKTITGMSEKDAVNILLNWVQTAFVYGYDDQVWGGDRAFFAQETLFYPYCDCEDRSILFSRLVRDLVGLNVVLLYYPGHLATAVAFSEDVQGDWLSYQGRKYIVCDPTYIGAGVGKTMPKMNNQQAQIIALE